MKYVLAIDDIEPNLELIRATLKYHIPDCEVIAAISGEEGIRLAREKLPDTILLDIFMPDMDGFEVCRILKADDITRHIPVIFISAVINDSESIVKGLDMGADAFITKPINPAELSTQVKVMLRIKEAEDNLKKENEKYRLMTEKLPDAVATINTEGKITYVSPKALDIFGYENTEEVIGNQAVRALIPGHRSRATKALELVMKGRTLKDMVFRFSRKDSSRFTGELSASLIRNDKGEPVEVIMTIKDITSRKKAENEILTYQNKLKTLNSQLISAEEKERRKIAINLHDTIGQTLSIAHIKLSSLSDHDIPQKTKKTLQESTELLQTAISESKSLIYNLSPPIFYELGLIHALRWRLEQIRERMGIRTSFTLHGDTPDFGPEINILVYRSINELLTNIMKHAQADQISLIAGLNRNQWVFTVSDNGKGFEYQPTSRITHHKGFGLFSIKERLDSIQGKLIIDSSPGMGTRISINIPN